MCSIEARARTLKYKKSQTQHICKSSKYIGKKESTKKNDRHNGVSIDSNIFKRIHWMQHSESSENTRTRHQEATKRNEMQRYKDKRYSIWTLKYCTNYKNIHFGLAETFIGQQKASHDKHNSEEQLWKRKARKYQKQEKRYVNSAWRKSRSSIIQRQCEGS